MSRLTLSPTDWTESQSTAVGAGRGPTIEMQFNGPNSTTCFGCICHLLLGSSKIVADNYTSHTYTSALLHFSKADDSTHLTLTF